MSIRLWPTAASLAFVFALLGCVSGSGVGSPTLRTKRLVPVALDSVKPRELSLITLDTRDPRPANSDSMLAHVDVALRSVLSRSGIEVRSDAVNTLTVRVGYPEVAMDRQKPEDCIAMQGILHVASGGTAASIGESCFGLRNMFGMRVSNDPKGVYETAVNSMFQGLDKVFRGLTLR